MSNKKLHHYWGYLRQSNYWIFLVVFLVSGALAVYGLRQNNLTMINYRDKVYEADKNGGDTEATLRDLRQYIYAHMNTNPSSGNTSIKPPIQLKYTYERLVEAEKKRANEVNAKVYSDAQTYCESQDNAFSGRSRVPCIEQYVSQNGAKERPIDESLYKFDFVSPRWSFDLAGISLLISLASLIIFAILFGADRWARWELSRHQ